MSKRGLVGTIPVLGARALVGAAGTLAGIGPRATVVGGLIGGDAQPPALLSFESVGVHCVDEFSTNSSTSVASSDTNTEGTYAHNVSLPGPSYAIGGPTFERQNESTYVLSVPTEETDKPPRECPGVARYDATMRIPAGDGPWRIVVNHDNETVTTIEDNSESGVAGGSASVIQSSPTRAQISKFEVEPPTSRNERSE